jgi:hypothetical protein
MLVLPDSCKVSAPLKILRMVMDGLKAIPISCMLSVMSNELQSYFFRVLNRF